MKYVCLSENIFSADINTRCSRKYRSQIKHDLDIFKYLGIVNKLSCRYLFEDIYIVSRS